MGLFGFKKKEILSTSTGQTVEQVIDAMLTDTEKAGYEFNSPEEMYTSCPYLRAIVDYKLACLMNVKIQMFRKQESSEDVEVLKHPVLDLIKNPNPFQVGQNLLALICLHEHLYGRSFLRGVKGLATGIENSKALWCLPPSMVQIFYQNNNVLDIYSKFQLSDIVDHYQYLSPEGIHKLYEDEIFYSNVDIFGLDSYSIGITHKGAAFDTLRQTVSNLMYIQESRGVITKTRGALGMLSQNPNNKDAGGMIPIDKADKDNIKADYKKLYGLRPGQSSILIPDVPMVWQPMILDIKQLQLDESALHEFQVVCDTLMVPRSLFDDKSKFNNQLEVKRKLYQDVIIPYANGKMLQFTEKFGLDKQGLYLHADFGHVQCMQENLKEKEDVEKIKTDRVTELYQLNLISKGTVKTELGYVVEDQNEFKIFYKDEFPNQVPFLNTTPKKDLTKTDTNNPNTAAV